MLPPLPLAELAYRPDAADERFVFNQLIAYIGNKRKLLPTVYEALRRSGVSTGTFADLFAGSGVVARMAKLAGFRVLANDWEPYAATLNAAFIGLNRMPPFAALGGVERVYADLNELPPLRGYIAAHYCPRDDAAPDPAHERMFYTSENGQRIDAMREQIARWRSSTMIDADEEHVLLASLIYAGSYYSNTSGVFKAFHCGWGGATRTAWYRIRARLTLRPPTLWDNGQQNSACCADANLLARETTGQVAYLDPPYNQHQYGSNYHLLNTIALWDKPTLNPSTRVDGRSVNKAAIRQDWLQHRRSAYCYRASATAALADLLAQLRFDTILLSYSSEGIIPLADVLDLLHERGAVDYAEQPYKRYRVSSQRASARSQALELTFVVDTGRRSCRAARQAMGERLTAAVAAIDSR